MEAICNNCERPFTYGHSSTGKFCSNECSGIFKTKKHKEQWLTGVDKRYDRSRIRIWLTEDRGYNCSVCNISEWNGKSIVLQVDHIDGNAGNDTPDNLRLICPNCHSQSDTFSGRNRGNGRAARGLPLN